MIVAMVGAGRLAEGIAVRVLAGGHGLRVTDSEPGKADALVALLAARAERPASGVSLLSVIGVAEAIAGADVVMLALPYPQGRAVARQQGAALSGVTVVDTCNPVDFSTFDSLLTSPGSSAAEEIASASPGARVVKAFNTTFVSALISGSAGGQPLDVFLAGDHPRAKSQVAALIRDGGMRPVDTGPLRRARELESFQLLHMTLQGPLGLDWASAIKLLPLRDLRRPGRAARAGKGLHRGPHRAGVAAVAGWSRRSGSGRPPPGASACSWSPTSRRRGCTASWMRARTASRSRSPGVSRCGCTRATRTPAGCATGTSCGSSTTAVPAWPGWRWMTRCGPGSRSCPPGRGTTPTRPIRASAGTATRTGSPPTFPPRPSAGDAPGSWRSWRPRPTGRRRRRLRSPGARGGRGLPADAAAGYGHPAAEDGRLELEVSRLDSSVRG